ncbi:MAG: glycerol-3-phosphate 1-O-acyltransferase PlsY [Oscillospiraceae bacterium]|nr:glycerol-3-phosphate 1-O-acyltransferase PlsY [Oscillospiraceae bacterium]
MTALAAVMGYLIGSVSVAVIYSKIIYRRDVRTQGSGNAGATNVARVFGIGAGLLTFAGDGLKTAAAMLLGRLIAGEPGFIAAGAACLIGHAWPVYFGFKGGKGVTVSAVIGIMLDWRIFAIGISIFIIVALLTKRVSAGSMLGAFSYPFSMLALGSDTPARLGLCIFVVVSVFFMHRENIKRLLKGTEPPFRAHK